MQWVYRFGGKDAEGDASMGALLGGKGANLAEMCRMGLPVPPGFTITTEACRHYYAHHQQFPSSMMAQCRAALASIESRMGLLFGDPRQPLLVSVRSGASVSMPGMMDTILNLGLSRSSIEGLAARTGQRRFALDSYRRLLHMYSTVVLGLGAHWFEEPLEVLKIHKGYVSDTDVTAEEWESLIEGYEATILEQTGRPFPQDAYDQLEGAVGAVFRSWMSARAVTYRRHHRLGDEGGTAVTVQAMVFGNMGLDSATGVAFTRDPSSGEPLFFGEYLLNAQGEDVVAGIRTPHPLTRAASAALGDASLLSLEEAMPTVFEELVRLYRQLERHYRDMQDIEFTIENGRLWLLQTRSGKRSAKAAVVIAVHMVAEGLITEAEALCRIAPELLDQLLHPTIDRSVPCEVLDRGLPASPGAASGRIVLSADRAEAWVAAGHKVLLVRAETSPEDIHGMVVAEGVLTSRGGMTSHAAVVARGMGKPCVCGATSVRVDESAQTVTIGSRVLREGDVLTIHGATGEIMLGEVPTVQSDLPPEWDRLMEWADRVALMTVRANADTPQDARVARRFGAKGIGLCRTEHMFFQEDRLRWVREMIVSETVTGRQKALERLRPMQYEDFVQIFEAMSGCVVTVRLLDPPLHEFLPHHREEKRALAEQMGLSMEAIEQRCERLVEANPMLGHRGCRLAVTFPEIYVMQVEAALSAALEVQRRGGATIVLELMVPLVMSGAEMALMRRLIDQTAEQLFLREGSRVAYRVGTMIELPRAALCADELAEHADFFSFGTNDLTQTTLGISRDDAGSFLGSYRQQGLIMEDPFVALDQQGVGALMRIAVEKGRAVRPDLGLGICGEHGGHPASIVFFGKIGLQGVSCSPYRVPLARLAAAHAALGVGLDPVK